MLLKVIFMTYFVIKYHWSDIGSLGLVFMLWEFSNGELSVEIVEQIKISKPARGIQENISL